MRYCPPRRRAARAGFTLIELSVVVFIIGIIAALAFPHLLPVIAFSQLEGQARHLANYGRSAVAMATMTRQELTVYFDLDEQQYYTIRLVYPEPEGEAEGEQSDQLSMLSEMRGGDPMELAARLAEGRSQGGMFDEMPEDFDDEAANQQMAQRFNQFARAATEERAKNVKHEEGILEDVGPLFEEEDQFSLEEMEPVEEEVAGPILERVRLENDVVIEYVVIEGESHSSGVVELKISPLGLHSNVGFHLSHEDAYYTVTWDAASGGAKVEDGKVAIVQ